ncbi:MAG: peptidoglycan-binding protein [Candidatus Omnitrophica bacterium]|nr:peptidoglycan-binding protein [Candidatus Omnitrophota bacterium]
MIKRQAVGWVAFLAVVLLVTGCFKKASDQANLSTTTGFDSLSMTEELSQLPQASTSGTPAQQTAVETLPIEVSPVTPPLSTGAEYVPAAVSTQKLSHDQEIQTALKNAGFYNGAIDGRIGPASKKAIQAFQESQGLKVDGKVGPKTWAALEPFLRGTSMASTSTSQTN